MEKLIDFDALFSDYLKEWYAEHKNDYLDFGDLEEAAAAVYGEWSKKPLPLLGGFSPKMYFDRITDPQRLVALTVKYVMSDMSPPVLLCDRIADEHACEPYLVQIVRLSENTELTVTAAGILTAMQSKAALPVYADWIFSEKTGAELCELAVEKLTANIEAAGPMLLERIEGGPLKIETAKYAADVLTHYGKDERIYNLLVRLFREGGDVPLYASYLGKYGDARALPLLTAHGKRKDINYLEFIELRNAVEALGGELVSDKDFSNDKYYKAIREEE